ncbi:MAG TPA: hypothetical protein V6D12_14300 [Candidatus Obscuribacterales bacterium]
MNNEIIEVASTGGITVARDPNTVLEEAKNAAKALMTVVSQKKKPVVINNEQYLEFEDWQTVGRFYGVTAKVTKTELIDLGGVKGYEATAEVIRNSDGMVISSADAMCLNDEEKWSTRAKYEYINGKKEKVGDVPVPLFQLRSMAQTRACAKALRNVLAWVVVLAGFKPTPAEEMTGNETSSHTSTAKAEDTSASHQQSPPPPQPKSNGNGNGHHPNAISEPQAKRLFAIAMGAGMSKDQFQQWLLYNYNFNTTKEVTKEKYEEICKAAENYVHA